MAGVPGLPAPAMIHHCGYDGTRVADIAAAAGVSNGALYAHFGSKTDLLSAARCPTAGAAAAP